MPNAVATAAWSSQTLSTEWGYIEQVIHNHLQNAVDVSYPRSPLLYAMFNDG